jgi:BirA family biotin operon repressor/biotin-[acetyl-CoA-carboxylase] ligase
LRRKLEPAPLAAEKLHGLVTGLPLVSRLIVLDSVGSTNDEVRRLAEEGTPEGTVVVADEQFEGRGRMGRAWHSARGLGLYVSVLLRPERPAGEVTRWTLGAAIAACRACLEGAGCDVQIKWPNDLLHAGRKVGGVLGELRSAGGQPKDLVLGFGLNVLHGVAQFPPELRNTATSLRLASGRGMLDREQLAALLLARLGQVCGRLRRGEWDKVAREWERLAPHARGVPVRVLHGEAGEAAFAPFEGLTRGLDTDGALRVEKADGSIISVRSAESVFPVE